VSGPVPKEKFAAVTVVLLVMPERFSVNVAGPMVYGVKLWKPLFTLPYVPPFASAGAIISEG